MVASAAFSSSLFMATANPATLMALGNGVGSAVMGAGGIVAQAPFIAIASSIPVVAPILALQALSTAVIMQQFKLVDRKLDTISRTLDRVIARIEATHAGELLAASRIVDDVYQQYIFEGAFSNDMIVRLALAERDARALAARFRQLVEAREIPSAGELHEVQQTNYDAHSAMLASLVELRVSYLRVCIDMQENPKSVSHSTDHLKHSIDDGIAFWEYLQNRSQAIKAAIRELEQRRQGLGWQDKLPGGERASVEKELVKLKASYALTMESELEITSEFHALVDAARSTREAIEASSPMSGATSPTLVYWKDDVGEHSFVTEENLISERS